MHKLLTVVLISISLVGCATSHRIPVSQDATQSVRSTSAVVLLRQEEIIAEYTPATSNVSAGIAGVPGIGLLLAVAAGAAEGAVLASINANRAKEAETKAMPVRDALIDYDFRTNFKTALGRELTSIAWLNVNDIKYESPDADLQQLTKAAEQNNVMILKVLYTLTPGLRSFRLACDVAAHPNDEKLRAIAAKERPNEDPSLLYRNSFVYTHPLPVPYENAEQAAQAWSANKGEAIRSALNQGIDEIARMIAMDIQPPDAAKPAGAATRTTYGNVGGILVSETEDRAILRLDSGALHSASKRGAHELTVTSR